MASAGIDAEHRLLHLGLRYGPLDEDVIVPGPAGEAGRPESTLRAFTRSEPQPTPQEFTTMAIITLYRRPVWPRIAVGVFLFVAIMFVAGEVFTSGL